MLYVKYYKDDAISTSEIVADMCSDRFGLIVFWEKEWFVAKKLGEAFSANKYSPCFGERVEVYRWLYHNRKRYDAFALPDSKFVKFWRQE